LEWFADLKRMNARTGNGDGPVSNYHYRVLAKKSGSIRLIEAPKKKLKELQRVILRELLEKIPSHPAAHGFVRGRSIKTFAAPHVGRMVVLRMDLRISSRRSPGRGCRRCFVRRVTRMPLLTGWAESAPTRRRGGCGDAGEGARSDGEVGGAGVVCMEAFAAGRTDFAGAGESLRVSSGLPFERIGRGGGREIHAVCG